MIIKVKFQKSNLNFLLKKQSDFSSFYQVYVERRYPHLMELIKEGDTIVDPGANVGTFTTIVSLLTVKSGLVTAVEPDPDNLATLKENIRINKLDNVIIIDKALFNKSNEVLNFYQDGVMSRIVIGDKNSDNLISVRTITFDDIIRDYDVRPNVMKMVIEGSEYYALQKSTDLMKSINYLEAEIHSSECEIVLRETSNLDLISSPVRNVNRVIGFTFRHPIKTLKLEYFNHFETTKRILRERGSEYKNFPKIFFW
ncbi:MAG: FkbM family methyltransferase [Nitrososphaerota archaeon]